MREAAKAIARALATIVVSPVLLSFAIKRTVIGADRALEGSSQLLALVPGLPGIYLRRAFLQFAIAGCASTVTVEFGTLFSQAGARLDDNAYVGPGCHLGLVHLERNVLLAAGVHIPSGGATHGTDDAASPIRDQPGARTLVRVGEGTWIGSAAVVLADIGRHSVVGAGAVVTRPLPEFVVAAGVPAKVLRSRRTEPVRA
jgi:acetyltransferase-like isoleucine patch superfamily enzyme